VVVSAEHRERTSGRLLPLQTKYLNSSGRLGAAGAITGDEEKKAEGRAQQRASAAAEEAAQKERTRQEEAKEAEKECDRQERKGKGPLGGITDTLTGR
jgi:uncharacterized protein YjbJ (UPF0337 family)